MLYNEIDGCDCTLEEALKDCSGWLKARRKRHAKPANVSVNFLTLDCFMKTNLTESPDDIIAALFDASLYNKRIIRIQHLYDEIYIVVSDAIEKTNIDLPVMEAILSWFKSEIDKKC